MNCIGLLVLPDTYPSVCVAASQCQGRGEAQKVVHVYLQDTDR